MPTPHRGSAGKPVTRALTGSLQEPASGAEAAGKVRFAWQSDP